MPFIPQNEQLQQLLNSIVDPKRFSAAFDNLLNIRKDEQGAGLKLFQSIAATNPGLAQHLLGQPGVSKALTEPSTIRKKGEGTPAQVLEAAAGTYKPTSGLKSTDVRGATQIVNTWAQNYQKVSGKTLTPPAIKLATTALAAGQPVTPAILGVDDHTFEAIMAADPTTVGLNQQLLMARVSEVEKQTGKPIDQKERLRIYREEVLGKTPDEVQKQLLDLRIQNLDASLRNADLRGQLTDALSNLGRPMTEQESAAANKRLQALELDANTLNTIVDAAEKVNAGAPGANITLLTTLPSLTDSDLSTALLSIGLSARLSKKISPAQIDFLKGLRDQTAAQRDRLRATMSVNPPRQAAPLDAGTPDAATPTKDDRVQSILKLLIPELQKAGITVEGAADEGAGDEEEN
jgi:hypothetical protein